MKSFNTEREAEARWSRRGGFVFDMRGNEPGWYKGERFLWVSEEEYIDDIETGDFIGEIAHLAILES